MIYEILAICRQKSKCILKFGPGNCVLNMLDNPNPQLAFGAYSFAWIQRIHMWKIWKIPKYCPLWNFQMCLSPWASINFEICYKSSTLKYSIWLLWKYKLNSDPALNLTQIWPCQNIKSHTCFDLEKLTIKLIPKP